MEHIIDHLRETIEDNSLTRSERRSVRSVLNESPLDGHQLSVLRSKIFELANEKINSENYRSIVDWVRQANSALLPSVEESSDTFFSPGDACRNSIIHHIDSAQADLKICVFTISDDWITEAIIRSHRRGVQVQIITDDDKSSDEGSDITTLWREGIPIKMDNSPNHMHHKFMVKDARTVLTGSYNWTRSAARFNHENVLITHEIGVVRSFMKEFGQLWKAMVLYS
jgi:cardiolipin hydrolase